VGVESLDGRDAASSVALALGSPWSAARTNRFWSHNRLRPPQCGGMVSNASYDKREDVGPSLPRRVGLGVDQERQPRQPQPKSNSE
jgi:hypothetical protein